MCRQDILPYMLPIHGIPDSFVSPNLIIVKYPGEAFINVVRPTHGRSRMPWKMGVNEFQTLTCLRRQENTGSSYSKLKPLLSIQPSVRIDAL